MSYVEFKLLCHIVLAATDTNSGRSLPVISLNFVPRGAEESVQFGIYNTTHTVICYPLYVNVC